MFIQHVGVIIFKTYNDFENKKDRFLPEKHTKKQTQCFLLNKEKNWVF